MNLIDSIEAIVRATESRQHTAYGSPQQSRPAPDSANTNLQSTTKDDSPPAQDRWEPTV